MHFHDSCAEGRSAECYQEKRGHTPPISDQCIKILLSRARLCGYDQDFGHQVQVVVDVGTAAPYIAAASYTLAIVAMTTVGRWSKSLLLYQERTM